MKKIISALALLLVCALSYSQDTVEKWGRFEFSCRAAVKSNPFDVKFTATFTNGSETKTVRGFYDGNDTFVVRFMPGSEGTWNYVTASNVPALNRKKGSFVCTPALEGNHGPVEIDGLHFKYADGTRYYPVGTTSYDWMHVPGDYPSKTIASLKASGFNKIRSLFFLHNLNIEYPEVYPFLKNADGSWDYEHFNPEYFRYVEDRILALQGIGVEMDLILFHPYDGGRWGFDRMPMEVNMRYLDYITARFAAFRNIWWSMVNEYGGVRTVPYEGWIDMAQRVDDGDPYGHPLSIHGYTAQYHDYFNPVFTHTSIQDHKPVMDAGNAFTIRNIYKKPVVFDEVCYEGNNGARWGILSGQEMLHRMYNGLMSGTYVTHAECFNSGPSDDMSNYLAFGGDFHGESWKRINFLRNEVLADLPNPLGLADSSWDSYTSTGGTNYYLIYLGKQILKEWRFELPAKNNLFRAPKAGTKFKVEIIDTWNMTVTEYPGVYELAAGTKYRMYDTLNSIIRLPETPYLLLRIKEAE